MDHEGGAKVGVRLPVTRRGTASVVLIALAQFSGKRKVGVSGGGEEDGRDASSHFRIQAARKELVLIWSTAFPYMRSVRNEDGRVSGRTGSTVDCRITLVGY